MFLSNIALSIPETSRFTMENIQFFRGSVRVIWHLLQSPDISWPNGIRAAVSADTAVRRFENTRRSA